MTSEVRLSRRKKESSEDRVVEKGKEEGGESIAEAAAADAKNNNGSNGNNTSDNCPSNWEKLKYYFNRFRYYHFLVADTVDKYVAAACMWIIKWYFRLFLGIGQEPPSIMTQ